MPRPNRAAELAAKLLHTLGEQRRAGAGSYPLSLDRLVELAAPEAKPALVKKALAHETFRAAAILSVAGKPGAPTGFAADRDLLAESPLLLQYLLSLVTKAKKPTASLDQLITPLADDLRPGFLEAVRRRVTERRLPPGVGVLDAGDAPTLYLEGRASAAWLLAAKLICELETSAPDGVRTLRQLAERAVPRATAAQLRTATAEKLFKARVLLALPNNLESPVAPADHLDCLAASPLVLELALAATRTADNQAVKVTDLKKKLDKKIALAFATALTAAIASGTLPPAVGSLRIKKTPYLFFTRDVGHPALSSRAPSNEPRPSGSAPTLDTLIEEAFDRLNREQGGHNLVNLLALRQAVSAERDEFDAGLLRLRWAGRFTLGAAEGRHGLSPEERAAGVVEDGVLLLYVSRTEK